MQKDRLLYMAQKIEEIPENRFDFSIVAKETPCGNVGCAMGHCSIIFPDHFRYERTVNQYMTIVHKDGYSGFSAVQRFFGLTEDECDFLFTPNFILEGVSNGLTDYSSAKEVADNIRRFVA